jgi:hypothetical protein
MPILNIRPNPPPTGTIQVLSLLAFQLAVMSGELVSYQPSSRL